MKKKIRVAILFGGRSAEHEVSLLSAKNILSSLDKSKYEPVLIGITKSGHWLPAKTIALLPGKTPKDLQLLTPRHFDVVFPALHGPYGEDGTVQGLLKLVNLPFVGAGVLGSAIGMDKDVQKRILRDGKIPVTRFVVLTKLSIPKLPFPLPIFVKPANLGSSVGVTKVMNKKSLQKAINLAFQYDRKVLLEEAIPGREIEISVLGNENPIASLPGEVITTKKHQFYSYEAKYLDENGAILKIPANLPAATIKKIQKTAISAYKTLCCEGMARVDMFLTANGKVYINEINTIPGFTNISMYPKLWQASGLSPTKLIDKLIQLAIDRFKKEQKLQISR